MFWIAVLCFCILRTASVQSPLETLDDPKNIDGELSLKDTPSMEAEGVWSRRKLNTLFARGGLQERQRLHVAKPKAEPPLPARRCSHVMESCVPNAPCCDPCATCHCRFFSAICHCWRLGQHCSRRN